jgi:hypothetical protein
MKDTVIQLVGDDPKDEMLTLGALKVAAEGWSTSRPVRPPASTAAGRSPTSTRR